MRTRIRLGDGPEIILEKYIADEHGVRGYVVSPAPNAPEGGYLIIPWHNVQMVQHLGEKK